MKSNAGYKFLSHAILSTAIVVTLLSCSTANEAEQEIKENAHENKGENNKPTLFKRQLNALDKAKQVQDTINKAAQKRSLEIKKQESN